MNKIAIFVEGRTELEFDSKLILEIAQTKHIAIETWHLKGKAGNLTTKSLISKTTNCPDGVVPTHFFVIFNCRGDSQVKTRMVAEYANLVKSGYNRIACHRDVAPDFAHADLPKLEQGIVLGVKTNPIVVDFIFSVVAVEAWFLAQYQHFEEIDSAITLPAIVAALGFDPSVDDMALRPAPAEDLGNCYALAGKGYDKFNTQPTIDAIDFVEVYVELAARFPHLLKLCKAIDEFLEMPVAAGN